MEEMKTIFPSYFSNLSRVLGQPAFIFAKSSEMLNQQKSINHGTISPYDPPKGGYELPQMRATHHRKKPLLAMPTAVMHRVCLTTRRPCDPLHYRIHRLGLGYGTHSLHSYQHGNQRICNRNGESERKDRLFSDRRNDRRTGIASPVRPTVQHKVSKR